MKRGVGIGFRDSWTCSHACSPLTQTRCKYFKGNDVVSESILKDARYVSVIVKQVENGSRGRWNE